MSLSSSASASPQSLHSTLSLGHHSHLSHSLTSSPASLLSSSSSSSPSLPPFLSRSASLEHMALIAQQQQLQDQRQRKDSGSGYHKSDSTNASVGSSISSSSGASSPSHSSSSHTLRPLLLLPHPQPPTTSTSSSSTPHDPHKRIRASKNKQKHNESESRRRDRLRTQFMALRAASECDKKDRIAILSSATERLRAQELRVRQYEQEREMLIAQLNAANLHNIARPQPLSLPGMKKEGFGGGGGGSGGDAVESIGKLLSGQYPFLAHLPCAFIGLDGKFLDLNSAFLHLTSYTPDYLLSSTIFAITPQHELTPTFFQLKRLLAGELDCWETDRTCLIADGSMLPVHLTMTVTKSAQGKPEYFTCFFVTKEGAQASNNSAGGAQVQQTHHQQQSGMTSQLGLQMSQQQLAGVGQQMMGSTNNMAGLGQVVLTNPSQLTSLPSANSLQLLSSSSSQHPQHPHAALHQLSGMQMPMQAVQQRFDTFSSFPLQQHM